MGLRRSSSRWTREEVHYESEDGIVGFPSGVLLESKSQTKQVGLSENVGLIFPIIAI